LKESHQTTLEELETSNEELQSTNEELQSVNEELETSKEEMQSLNEELTTVNTELESKVEELSQSNDDMQNLLNSTDIATVFLDSDLNIKRYTEQAKELIMLRQIDMGRPLSELASALDQADLVGDCRAVLKTLMSRENEVRTKEGRWYLMRVMPYRTAENVIEGLVLTFVDIHQLKKAEKTLWRMSKVFMESPEPILILSLQGEILDLNEQALRDYGFARQELVGQPISKLVPKAEQQGMKALLDRCRNGERVRNVPSVHLRKSGEQQPVLLTLILLSDNQGAPEAIAIRTREVEGGAMHQSHHPRIQ
jgi:two-component system CheB/CheR fusion protein